MMKFFRKYMKTMLAVFMALLLIVWLGGEALTSFLNRSNDFAEFVVGHAYGQPVKTADLARITSQEEIGARLIGQYWSQPWNAILPRATNDLQVIQFLQARGRDRLSAEEWYLLETEAKRQGVHVSQAEVNELKAALPAEALNAFREQFKVSIRQIDDALLAYLRVYKAAARAVDAVNVSEADIRDFVRNVGEKIQVEMVVVDPQKLIDTTYQPTEEELKAQFEKYKDQPAGGPGDFGYQKPEATQVEYIEISVDELAKTQEVTDDEAYSYWLAHKTEFKRPATQPASTQPTTRPEQPKPYDTFTEAKSLVRQKLQQDKAKQAANRLATDLIRQLSRPWANQPTTQPGNFKQPPESEMAGDLYEKLVARYQERYPGVLSYGRTELAPADQLASNPRIGRARAFAGTPQTVPFQQAAFMVAGLSAVEGRNDANARLFRNVYETSAEPLVDALGNVFVFRNIATQPAEAPASFEEVRDKLVEDLRTIRAGEQAEQTAQNLAERAKGSDLKTAFQSDAALAAKLESSALLQPEPFARQSVFPGRNGGMPQVYGTFVPGVGFDPQLVDAAFELASRATTTQPSPVTTHKDNRGRHIVIQYKQTLPVTQEEYNQYRDLARDYLLTQRRIAFLFDWFSPESIHARTDWKPTQPEQSPEQADQQGEPAGQAAS
ncbi:MAG TPA: hypothetical protein PLQ89_21415 [Phycisphaerae bacterium]|mgnify:FL=1|nr:hypothetical protein [Phycisphaerae bacterium]HOJ74524.1 hypothetical protein [Phycisphaerae bacterium]HOM53236.1 hypothetical protein [Phycisphaerae bacterium]HOQ88271.1 hypothetical protein [Phycisphaerae bacterium]HPP28385.1 hypothetical protein [Phycisphaerae bacterium]